jgi:hypothetical protein
VVADTDIVRSLPGVFAALDACFTNPLDLVPQTLSDERLVLAGYSTPSKVTTPAS